MESKTSGGVGRVRVRISVAASVIVASQLVACVALIPWAGYKAYEKWLSDTYTVTIEVDRNPDELYATMSRVIKQRNPDAEIVKDDRENREFEARGTLSDGSEVESSWSVEPLDGARSELRIRSKVDERSKEEVERLTHQSLREVLSGRRIRWRVAD